MERTRWWRVTYADGRRFGPGQYAGIDLEGLLQVWCETSNEEEAREALQTCPSGGVLWCLYERIEREWRVES